MRTLPKSTTRESAPTSQFVDNKVNVHCEGKQLHLLNMSCHCVTMCLQNPIRRRRKALFALFDYGGLLKDIWSISKLSFQLANGLGVKQGPLN